jgi:hypothetical protein
MRGWQQAVAGVVATIRRPLDSRLTMITRSDSLSVETIYASTLDGSRTFS